MSGGGGSSGVRYDNLERLYGMQADAAKFQQGQVEKYLPGANAAFAAGHKQYESPEYATTQGNRAAAMAGTASDETSAQGTQDMMRQMAAMGIMPNANTMGGMLRKKEIGDMAAKAAGMTSARLQGETSGRAQQMAALGDQANYFSGMGSQAMQGMSSAANTGANIAQMKQQGQQMQNQGLMGAGMTGMWLMSKDGGPVQRLAGGGPMMRQPWYMAPPQQAPQGGAPTPAGPSPLGMASQMGMSKAGSFSNVKSIPGKMTASGGQMAQNIGNMTGNQTLSAWGTGRSAAGTGQDVSQAVNTYRDAANTATQQGQSLQSYSQAGQGMQGGADAVNGLDAMSDATSAAKAGADAAQYANVAGNLEAGAAGAMPVAEGVGGAAAGAAGAGSTALAAASAAMPWIGAAVLAGSAFGLFADGGFVRRKNGGPPNRILADHYANASDGANRRYPQPQPDNFAKGKGGGDSRYQGGSQEQSDRPLSIQERRVNRIVDYGNDGPPPAGADPNMYADGGLMRKARSNKMTRGGDVDGPGTETSDSVPALLSDGEYVLNAGAVRMIGMDKLEALNQQGLMYRRG